MKSVKIIRVVAACHIVNALGASVFIAVIWASKTATYKTIDSEILTAGFLTLRLMPGGVLHLFMPRIGSTVSTRFALILSWLSSLLVLSSLVLLGKLSSVFDIAVFSILIVASSLLTPISASSIRQTPIELTPYLSESKSTTLIVGATPWLFGFVVSSVSFLLDNYGGASLVWIIVVSSIFFLVSIPGIGKTTVSADKTGGTDDPVAATIKEIYTPKFKLLIVATTVYYFCYGIFEIGMIQNLAGKFGEMAGIGLFWALFTVGAAGIMLVQFNFKYSNHLFWISGIIFCWSAMISVFPFADGWQIPLLALILGGSFAPYAIICNTYINRITTPKTIGMTYKTWSSILLFPTPIGLMTGGYLISILNDRSTLLLSGAVLMALSVIVLFQSRRKAFEVMAHPNKVK